MWSSGGGREKVLEDPAEAVLNDALDDRWFLEDLDLAGLRRRVRQEE